MDEDILQKRSGYTKAYPFECALPIRSQMGAVVAFRLRVQQFLQPDLAVRFPVASLKIKALSVEAGSPYCELTDAVLPSSLTRVLPITLVLLHLPTCVGFRYGRLHRKSYDAFPGNCFTCSGLGLRPHSLASLRRLK